MARLGTLKADLSSDRQTVILDRDLAGLGTEFTAHELRHIAQALNAFSDATDVKTKTAAHPGSLKVRGKSLAFDLDAFDSDVDAW